MPTTWFITGCSSGFGETFVRQLRAAGDNVIASGRHAEDKLAHLKDTGAAIVELDVTSSVDVINSKVQEVWDIYPGGVDVVVNNAGSITSGFVEELTQEDIELQQTINVHGSLNVTRAFLPKMREKGTGTVMFISSIGAWSYQPSSAAYSASKATLEVFVEVLAQELAIVSPGIKAFMVEPGFYRTPVFSKLHAVKPRLAEYAELNGMIAKLQASFIADSPGDPEKGVAAMIDLVKGTGLARGKTIPVRVPMGTDCLAAIRKECEETLAICTEWEEFAKSTDITAK